MSVPRGLLSHNPCMIKQQDEFFVHETVSVTSLLLVVVENISFTSFINESISFAK